MFISNLSDFAKKDDLLNVFLKLRTANTWLYKCLKSNVYENPSRVDILKGPKHVRNLYDSSFITF